MKKTVFALQVFGLIAMLPLLAILEMYRTPFHGNTISGEAGKIENVIADMPEKPASKLSTDGLIMSMEAFLLNTTW